MPRRQSSGTRSQLHDSSLLNPRKRYFYVQRVFLYDGVCIKDYITVKGLSGLTLAKIHSLVAAT